MRERGRENLEREERMNCQKTHQKLPLESIPMKTMMQGGEDHVERLSWKGKENVGGRSPIFHQEVGKPAR